MTNRDIVNVYLAYKGKRKTKGKEVNILFLMPFFIMDACYQVFCKEIKDYPCRHQMKLAKKRFRECYHAYTMDFFRAFNDEQVEFITDQMDEFNDYIHNSMVLLKSKVFSVIPDEYSFEEKKILAALLLCNVLAQAAQHLHGNMYRHSDMTKEVDVNIEGVKKASYDMARHHPSSKGVNLTVSDEVIKLVDALCKKIMKFLNDAEHEEV
jgi:hypothetical protein